MKDVFLIIFQNFHNSNFPNVLSKMWEEIFLEAFINQLFQNTQRKHFSWSLHLLMSEILDCRAVALEEKALFRKDFFGIFKILEHSFLSEQSQNVSVVQSGSRL